MNFSLENQLLNDTQGLLHFSDMNLWIQNWLDDEKDRLKLGVLATVDENNYPRSRSVAIREIDANQVLFFTQKGSQKVSQLKMNPRVSMTVILQENRRQIIFEGVAKPLTAQENIKYWSNYPKESRVRFMTYGALSRGVLSDKKKLDLILSDLQERYKDSDPNCPEAYMGYRINTHTLKLYQLNDEILSDSYIAAKKNDAWFVQRVVP